MLIFVSGICCEVVSVRLRFFFLSFLGPRFVVDHVYTVTTFNSYIFCSFLCDLQVLPVAVWHAPETTASLC
jgi:hypothetical protein